MLPGENLVETEFGEKVADSEFESEKKEKGGKRVGYTCSGLVLFPCPFPSLNQETQLK